MNQNIETKSERQLIRCSKCKRPLAEIKGNKIYVERYVKGKPADVKLKVEHDAGGQFKIICKGCGEAHFFARTQKVLGMTYVITNKKTRAVDNQN